MLGINNGNALKKAHSCSESFFDHAAYRFAVNAKLSAAADQTIAFTDAKLQGHNLKVTRGARKNFQFALHEPFSRPSKD
jgi:hypothetical protein